MNLPRTLPQIFQGSPPHLELPFSGEHTTQQTLLSLSSLSSWDQYHHHNHTATHTTTEPITVHPLLDQIIPTSPPLQQPHRCYPSYSTPPPTTPLTGVTVRPTVSEAKKQEEHNKDGFVLLRLMGNKFWCFDCGSKRSCSLYSWVWFSFSDFGFDFGGLDLRFDFRDFVVCLLF